MLRQAHQKKSKLSVDIVKIMKVQNNVFQTLKDHSCQARIPNPSKLKEEENMSAISLLNSVEDGKQEGGTHLNREVSLVEVGGVSFSMPKRNFRFRCTGFS